MVLGAAGEAPWGAVREVVAVGLPWFQEDQEGEEKVEDQQWKRHQQQPQDSAQVAAVVG